MVAAAQPTLQETFVSLQPELNSVMTNFVQQFGLPTFVSDRVCHLVDYTVSGGKMNRGMFVLQVGTMLIEANNLGKDKEPEWHNRMTKFLAVAGWCIELMQAFFLVADDVMDQSPMRRGKPSWYRCPGIGLQAVNDAVLLESLMFQLLRHYFHPSNPDSPVDSNGWIQLSDVFRSTILKTELGQVLDLTLTQQVARMEDYRLDNYLQMITYKTAFYSFVLPVQVAYGLTMNDWSLSTPFTEALVKLGCLFQVQDDYLDCYGDSKEMGKVGTDIQDGKYSFLVITAVHQILALPSQQERTDKLNELHANYANSDELCIQKVKEIFNENNLPMKYEQFVSQYECELHSFIKRSSTGESLLEGRIISHFLAKISNRSK